jgi:hypothetical protein
VWDHWGTRPHNQTVGHLKMYNKHIFYIVLIFLFLPQNLYAEDCPLKGKWKSNSELTLKGVETTETLTKERLEYLSEEIFGKLIVEFTCNSFITYYDNEKVKTDYKIIKQEGNFITIEYYEEALSEFVQDTLELIGDCYYSPPMTFGFKEAMCKIKE